MLRSRIDVLWTTRYRYEPGWKLQPHQHKYFQVSYIAGEAGRFQLGGDMHAIHGPVPD